MPPSGKGKTEEDGKATAALSNEALEKVNEVRKSYLLRLFLEKH